MPNNTSAPVPNPTWYGNIRQMFTQDDITHMQAQGLDLTSYDNVVSSAAGIYGQVAAGNMPPNAPWPPDQVTTFLNWMSNGYPKGIAPSQAAAAFAKATDAAATQATRIRKEITTLSAPEVAQLKQAFSGILAKDVSDPNSYFVQAGYHWLPGPLYCLHHVAGYNPWHRAYLISFENALRSVPGCENVTLPYWDITTPFPDVLKSPPFDSYTLPKDIGQGFKAGYVTTRYSYPDIQQNLLAYSVVDDINRALTKTDWEDFHGLFPGATTNDTIITAHDGGHVSIGDTMAKQDVAAFDPVFWFFHANWDRLWWKWQNQMQATNLNGLLSTIDKTKDPLSYQIFTVAPLEALAPFTANLQLNTLAIIDSANSLDVDYQDPPAALQLTMLPKAQRAIPASRQFSVQTERVNVRVDGLNRLKIPGSFKVHLLKDGKPIASRAFFQPSDVEKCENCVSNAVVHFDFELPLETIQNGKLGVWVEPVDKSVVGDRFPNKLMGNPTVEVRFLLSTE